jgi:Protein of unknown function (DUF2630)
MQDPQIHGTIEQLVTEEHELWPRESAGETTGADRMRLQELKIALDQRSRILFDSFWLRVLANA